MITPQNEQEYLDILPEKMYFVSADYTKMNQVQKDYIKVRTGGFYGNTVFAIMFKQNKPGKVDDIRDFFAIGFEDINGEQVATGITDFPGVSFGSLQDGQAWKKQFNLDNPAQEG